MSIKELEQRIDNAKLDRRGINIDTSPNYDERFNLYIRPDGKYAVFYGEHGFPTNQQLFDTEEAAADALWAELEYHMLRPVVVHSPFLKWAKGVLKRIKNWRDR